jgi:hypothetical protein
MTLFSGSENMTLVVGPRGRAFPVKLKTVDEHAHMVMAQA